jgi:hypothetical protein
VFLSTSTRNITLVIRPNPNLPSECVECELMQDGVKFRVIILSPRLTDYLSRRTEKIEGDNLHYGFGIVADPPNAFDSVTPPEFLQESHVMGNKLPTVFDFIVCEEIVFDNPNKTFDLRGVYLGGLIMVPDAVRQSSINVDLVFFFIDGEGTLKRSGEIVGPGFAVRSPMPDCSKQPDGAMVLHFPLRPSPPLTISIYAVRVWLDGQLYERSFEIRPDRSIAGR